MKIRAVAIGWNHIDFKVWGSTGALPDCEIDADQFAARWRACGIPTAVLLTADATRARIKGALITAIEDMVDGDLLIVSVSGHGSDKRDASGDEPSGKDQYICAYDGSITDDTIGEWFDSVGKAIKILFICDTCRSGSMGRDLPVQFGRDVLSNGPAQMILMAGCTEKGTSDSTGTGGRWTKSLCALSPQGKGLRLWFEAACMLVLANQAQQVPTWAEYGPVTNEFRNSPIVK